MVSAPSNHCYVPGTIFKLESGECMPAEEIASQYARHDKSGMTLAIRVLAPFGQRLPSQYGEQIELSTQRWHNTRSSLRNIHNCKNKYP